MFKDMLAAEFAPYCALSEVQLTQLEAHYLSLMKWNARLNLTRITDLADAVKFHYCESLFLGKSIPEGRQRIVDIGSGAGFPGIPVAILRRECDVALVESHQRKSVFLREVSRGLPNVHVISKRAEQVVGLFDQIVSRAVDPTDVLRLDLAPSFSLLLGEADASKLPGTFERVPWGNSRVLFHVKRPIARNH
jgi:16S rRNA (guanine527-N7)-methyltransferase